LAIRARRRLKSSKRSYGILSQNNHRLLSANFC
jgi:hypothetical protein